MALRYKVIMVGSATSDLYADLTACLACCKRSSAFFFVDVSCPMDEQGVKHFLDAAMSSQALPCLMCFMSAN